MAKAEAKRPDGIEAVAIVTPNYMHAGPIYSFLKAGVPANCDKPASMKPRTACFGCRPPPTNRYSRH